MLFKCLPVSLLLSLLCTVLVCAAPLWATLPPGAVKPNGAVTLVRVPGGGIQPQAAVDAHGILHVVYLHGDPDAENIYYVHKPLAGSRPFSPPLRVNSVPGSATALGSIRGAQIAVGRQGGVYVVWNGSDTAPKGPGGAPMLFARLNAAGTAFEPERNLITGAGGIDGGGSVAADAAGHVFVTWHASAPSEQEKDGHVYLARSSDDGLTFAPEARISPQPTGACGCCDMRALADTAGNVYVLYRAAGDNVHRDDTLLVSRNQGLSFQAATLQKWNLDACPLSTFWLTQGKDGVLGAWETQGQVYSARLDAVTAHASHLFSPAAGGRVTAAKMTAPMRAASAYRKYPVVVPNAAGEKLFAWVDGATYITGPRLLEWSLYDRRDKPTGVSGKVLGVPKDSVIAAYAQPDSRFVILY